MNSPKPSYEELEALLEKYKNLLKDRTVFEQKLLESEHLFRAIFNHNPGGMMIVDENYKIFDVNEETCKITGYSREELVGGLCDKICPKGSKSKQCPIWNENAAGFSGMETAVKCKGGKKTPIIKNAQRVKIQGKNYLLEAFLNISPLKISEQKRKEAEQQLRQAQKLESVGRLAGGVAHDLNNLLSPIIGYAEMLMMDLGEDKTYIPPLSEILKAGIKAKTMISQLLAFSKKQTLSYLIVDLNTTIANFEKLLRRTIRENIEINLILEDNLPLIKADAIQIEQVILNMVINAQDAIEEKGSISISTSSIEITDLELKKFTNLKPGKYIKLSIKDTGCGIEQDTIDKIFEPFYSTKGVFGTGLGLATAFGTIEQHNGTINCISKPGKGTTFNIYLPISNEKDNPTVPLKTETQKFQGKENILLAEDNAQVRQLCQKLLEKKGYKVFSAENGQQALDLLEKYGTKIELLLTDIVMPEMNGKELYLKASKMHPNLKVIYMSGYTAEVIKSFDNIRERNNFMQKPFSTKILYKKIREVLDHSL
jgi:PAS domain S-box-containing protein